MTDCLGGEYLLSVLHEDYKPYHQNIKNIYFLCKAEYGISPYEVIGYIGIDIEVPSVLFEGFIQLPIKIPRTTYDGVIVGHDHESGSMEYWVNCVIDKHPSNPKRQPHE